MRVLFAFISSFALSGCLLIDTLDKPDWSERASKNICKSLTKWVSTGPRFETGNRILFLPDAYAKVSSEIENDNPEEDVLILTAFAWDYRCPEDTECEDQADIDFIDTLRPYAHSMGSSRYFDHLEPCLMGGSVSDDWDRHDKDLFVEGDVAKTNVSLRWVSKTREAQISVQYK